jgi:hypothetical protein
MRLPGTTEGEEDTEEAGEAPDEEGEDIIQGEIFSMVACLTMPLT